MAEAIAGYVFYEIAALLVLAAALGFAGLLLRQPLIVSFIAVGIVAGPSGLDVAHSDEYINLLAELGIAILLFLVGLKLDLNLVRSLGPVAVMTGLGQVLFTSLFGFLIGIALGFDATTSIYIGVALTFSSTIIIVKLLSDKRELDSLHGRIALGFLIVQDLVVVFAMTVLSAFGVGAGEEGGAGEILAIAGYGVATLIGLLGFVRYVATPLASRLARSPELLISFVIGWAAALAALGDYLGFGKELGGLIAGVSLASTPMREAIAARLASLRDFLLLFFFIDLGATLDLSLLGDNLMPALIFSAFVLFGNPLIVLVIMSALGYRARTGFLAGLTVAQISEFSLIFIAMGLELGHVPDSGVGLVTLVGLITIAVSTYLITYSHPIYDRLAPVLAVFDRLRPDGRTQVDDSGSGEAADVLVFGMGRYGLAVAGHLVEAGYRVLGIDFDPEAVRAARRQGLSVLYGDATDPEFLAHLPLARADWAVCTVPTAGSGYPMNDPRHALMRSLSELGFRGRIAVAVHRDGQHEALERAGAHLVLTPFEDAAQQAADRIVLADAAGRGQDGHAGSTAGALG